MPFGPLEDTVLTAETPGSSSSRFRPYASPNHHVVKSRYITSNDPRGYIPVYEYPLNGQWIMMDVDDGYVLWTGIWKALGNSKADIVKMVESQPDLASQIRRVRGGYLKIQGTWMPYEVALRLSRRVAWDIRHDLVPLFGPTFPSTCLMPNQPGYGQVIPNSGGRRRPRRSTNGQNVFSSNSAPNSGSSNWAIVNYYPSETSPRWVAATSPPEHQSPASTSGQPGAINRSPSSRTTRYAPYPDSASPAVRSSSTSADGPLAPPYATSPPSSLGDAITLPPIHSHAHGSGAARPTPMLPPISSLADPRYSDSRAVLERLRASDDDDHRGFVPPPRYTRQERSDSRSSLDEQMRQRSQALLTSTSALKITTSTATAYESSSASTSSFERSPISPATPPHTHAPLSYSSKIVLDRTERDPRSLGLHAHAW